jgi:hypothetical protein
MHVPRRQVGLCAFTGSIRVPLEWNDLARELVSAACGDGLEYCFFRLPR